MELKKVGDMTPDEIKATDEYKGLAALPFAAALDESAILAMARSAISKVRAATSKGVVRAEALEFIKVCAARGLNIPEGGRLVIHINGDTEVRGPVKSGEGRKFRWDASKHYPKLIGQSFTRTLSKQAGEAAGDYSLAVNNPLATRADVPFSLVLTCPNGSRVTYPAAVRGKPTASEVEDVSKLVEVSQWGKAIKPHVGFSLHESPAFSEEEETDDAEEVDEDVGALLGA